MDAVGFQSKQLHGAAGAADDGASDVEDVLQALNLDTLQLLASVDLIRALGGGWEDSAAMAANRNPQL